MVLLNYKFEEGVALLQAALKEHKDVKEPWAYLGYAYVRMGRRQDAEKLTLVGSGVGVYSRAIICAALGDKDCAIQSLERSWLTSESAERLREPIAYDSRVLARSLCTTGCPKSGRL